MTTFTSDDREAAEQSRPIQITIGTIRNLSTDDEIRPFEIWNGEAWVECAKEIK